MREKKIALFVVSTLICCFSGDSNSVRVRKIKCVNGNRADARWKGCGVCLEAARLCRWSVV